MRASGECAIAVIGFQERTAAELIEFVVCFGSTDGDDSHRGRHQQSLFVCAVVGARQGQDADTQGLTRRAVKRGQARMHSRATECWYVPSLREPRGSVRQQ